MTRPALAYIVQLDLPGRPIKIGSTKNPAARFEAFNHGTPVACRTVGVTLDGRTREAEMLAATKAATIKGEWRYVTDELRGLVDGYHRAGEWYSAAGDRYDEDGVRQRIIAIAPDCASYVSRRIGPRSVGHYWANAVLVRSQRSDPLLHIHWAGFLPSEEAPSFDWPKSVRLAA